jgi:hypothetical protein
VAWIARLLALIGVLCLVLAYLQPVAIGGPGDRGITPELALFAAAVACFILSATVWVIELRTRSQR